ncbi:MAG TPA: HAMP domain-containing histidine kinase [Actinobacteria bacterium]|nr:HAMP domain-containing histidine kinase [Actinomycetota bacterium]
MPLRFRSARARSTIAATVVVALALIVAGFTAMSLQRAAMVNAIDTALIGRAEDITALIIDGSIPTQLTAPGDDDALVQIIDGDRTVIASSPNIAGESAISDVRPAAGTQVVTTQTLPVGEGEFRLVTKSEFAHDQTFTIYAAASLDPVREAVAALAAILIAGVPLLIAIVGVTVWFVIGRTLHPVEAIRSKVESISNRDLDRRVPVPDSGDEIARLAATMNEMLDRLEQSSDQQRRFVADASHELRSPLAAIRSQLEVDLLHAENADWSATSEGVLDETLRMQRLVDDLLLLARSDSGTLPIGHRSVDLDDIVFDLVKRTQPLTSVTIDTTHVSGAQVIGDADSLARLVRNLVENAVRFAVDRIEISLTEADGIAVLTVSDDGPGIPEADRDQVFERFTRLDEARDRDHGGAGLGLAISREITLHHAGSITADNGTLGGARITVEIPTRSR